MDVYDFDKTLYRNDATADFFKHCLKRYPSMVATLPATGVAAVRYAAKSIDITAFKQTMFRFLGKIPDVEAEVLRFWELNESGICGPCDPQPGDVVVSASPEFLLRGVCAKRGLALIASRVDSRTGIYEGVNCSRGEKVKRFRQEYPDARIERFFSDSLKDAPMAALADTAYMVSGGELVRWPG